MKTGRKIDLALEAKELAEGSVTKTTRLSGVKAQEDTVFGLPLTRVEILNRAGEEALGKPKGTYLTLTLPELPREREEILHTARSVAAMLESLPTLPKEGPVLVAGLGNRRVTPAPWAPGPRNFFWSPAIWWKTYPRSFPPSARFPPWPPGSPAARGWRAGSSSGRW